MSNINTINEMLNGSSLHKTASLCMSSQSDRLTLSVSGSPTHTDPHDVADSKALTKACVCSEVNLLAPAMGQGAYQGSWIASKNSARGVSCYYE